MGLMSGKSTAKARDGQEMGERFWDAPPKTAPAAGPHVRAAGPGRAWGKRGGRGGFRHASLPCYTEGVMVRRQVPSFSTR